MKFWLLVVAARYLMLNAPESALAEICALVPGSRAPSVLPLAEPGMVAVHSVIPAADEAGSKSISNARSNSRLVFANKGARLPVGN